MKSITLAGLVAASCAVAWIMTSKQPFQPTATGGKSVPTAVTPTVAVSPKPPAPEKEKASVLPPTPQSTPAPQSHGAAPTPVAAAPALVINGYEVQDPMARVALTMVGADPDADEYWVSAINDSAMPAEERKDLIEDLNEDGLSDPRHPSTEDLPLILSRLQLIEELAPNAMDEVNRAAFAEAQQDLLALLNGQEPR